MSLSTLFCLIYEILIKGLCILFVTLNLYQYYYHNHYLYYSFIYLLEFGI